MSVAMGSPVSILTQRGITLKLGNESKEYPPHKVGRGIKWREEVAPIVNRLMSEHESDITNPEDVKAAFVESPTDMAAIVASYVGMDLNEFLETVSEPELNEAFPVIFQIAILPFFQKEGMKKGLKQALRTEKNGKAPTPTPTT